MFKKFEPSTHVARNKVEFLLERGGKIVVDKREKVVIVRENQQATVDQWGRVAWKQKD